MKILGLFILIAFGTYCQEKQIGQIQFEGNIKSKETFLRQQLNFHEGFVFDSVLVESNAQFLRNTNLFFEVTFRIDLLDEKLVRVVFILDEVLTVFPILANGASSVKLNFTLGISDINFRGKGNTVGFIYQYYDRHSFKGYHVAPKHQNNKTGHELFIGKYSTIEPLYFENQTADFNFDNYHVSSAIYLWLNRYLKLSTGGALFYEKYKNRNVLLPFIDNNISQGQLFEFFKYQARAGLHFNKVQCLYERRNGLVNELKVEGIITKNYSKATFLKWTNEFKSYLAIGRRHNVLFRQFSGISSNNASPFSPFVVDDFINIRGVGNRVARGTAQFSFNLEYLFSLLKTKWFYIQVASFYDLGYQRPPGAKLIDSFAGTNTYQTLGIGMRMQTRKYYNTIIRLDYGWNLQDILKGGFVVGLGHFF